MVSPALAKLESVFHTALVVPSVVAFESIAKPDESRSAPGMLTRFGKLLGSLTSCERSRRCVSGHSSCVGEISCTDQGSCKAWNLCAADLHSCCITVVGDA